MDYNNFDSPDVLKKMQACQLVILKELKRVCEENDICFYLAYGSCLGAIRHKGFIPWDDDIDIFMKIEDFERLKKIQDKFQPRYFIQDHEKEEQYGLLIGRIRDSETTLIENDHIDRDINHGVYIDIYPLFNFGGNVIHRKLLVAGSFLCRLLAYNAPPMKKGKLLTLGAKAVLGIIPSKLRKTLEKKLYHCLTNQEFTGFYANMLGVSSGKYYPAKWFDRPVMVPFEDDMMPVPTEYIAYLENEFGDYMTPPPVDKRIIHHGYVYADFEKPYTLFKGVKYCVNVKDLNDKLIL